MAEIKFFDLVKTALPDDIEPDEIIALAPKKMWVEKNFEATVYALSKFKKINWEAYLENNIDVKEAKINPLYHFVKYGVFEGRKLKSWHPLHEFSNETKPVVSIVIINYNKEKYLEECIKSCINQTLQNIEIIIVDDASTDNSIEIIKYFANIDLRINVVAKKINQGMFMGRKSGVNISRGKYIIFLDSDDSLVPNACEICYANLVKGYDIVTFSANIINEGNVPEREILSLQRKYDNAECREYVGEEFKNAMFNDRTILWQIINKAFIREILIRAYNDLPENYVNYAEDLYAMLSIADCARNMLKIPDRLFNYNYGLGISTQKNNSEYFEQWMQTGQTCNAIEKYVKSNGIRYDIEKMYLYFCKMFLDRWINLCPEKKEKKYFDKIKDDYGFDTVIEILIEEFSKKKNKNFKFTF